MTQPIEECLLSIIVPVYNEVANIGRLLHLLDDALKGIDEYEIIFVDDGSSDGTLSEIQHHLSAYPNLHYISFSNNFGHQNALMAGLDFSRGKAVITMDGDLQHPSSLIPRMLELWQNGYDIVCTIREPDQNNGIFKEFTSSFFYKFLNSISRIKIKSGSADFRLLDRKVVDALKSIREYDIFYRGMISWLGFRQFELSYKPEKRYYGDSKYSFYKMARLAIAGVTSFSIMPLRFSALSGFFVALLSFFYGIYAVLLKILGMEVVTGWASIMVGLYFLGGIQLIAIGLCGEYIGRILMEVKRRPHYVIAESSLNGHRRGVDRENVS